MAIRLAECDVCGKEATYFRPYSGERYCDNCYVKAIEKRVQHTISKHRMLRPDDKVALALSGGKDSVSLLHILSGLEKRFPRSKMVAITIDEGIEGYRSEAVEIAEENCEKLDVEHHVYTFKGLYGYALDEIAYVARQKGKPFICSYCGILRRKALNVAAKKLNAAKLVTAHNLDDEVQSMVMNLLRGDLASLSREEHELDEGEELIPRVKPLREVPEREVALYAFLKKIRFQSLRCNYLETSLRSDVRGFLNTLETKHPGMKFTIYRSFEKIKPLLRSSEKRGLNLCRICGEPTTREVCMACQTLKDLGLIQ